MVSSFVQRAFRSFLYRSDRFWVPLWLRSLGLDLQGSVHFIGLPIVSLFQGSQIQIGAGSRLCSRSFGTALGITHPLVLRTLTSQAKISIGERVGISGGSICSAKKIQIGKGCLIGADVLIADTDFHPLRPSERHDSHKAFAEAKPVRIMENVFIGARVIILKGVTIGVGSVIGAGSVVTQDVPAGCIAAGNPCRVIRANL